MRGKIDCYGLSDGGKVREVNEDQFLIADLNKSMLIHQTSLSHEDHTRLFGGSQGQLFLVADGMGSHAEGKRASRLAVEALTHYVLNTMPWFFRLSAQSESDLEDELRTGLEECQRSIEVATADHPQRQQMGTTLTMAYLLWPRLYVVHAGDSRCYLYRPPHLHPITRDHTVAQRLVEQGALPAEQVESSRWSHVLWNCIGGGNHELNPDVYKANLQLDDTLLLCTDGLTKCLSDRHIAEILDRKDNAEETCRRLIEAANDQGSPDNVTVVVAHFREHAPERRKAHHEAAAEREPDPRLAVTGAETAA